MRVRCVHVCGEHATQVTCQFIFGTLKIICQIILAQKFVRTAVSMSNIPLHIYFCSYIVEIMEIIWVAVPMVPPIRMAPKVHFVYGNAMIAAVQVSTLTVMGTDLYLKSH